MNDIQKYFKYRQSLIDQYLKGDMTKREYLKENYDAVMNSPIQPFKNIDTIEKALYNYQYYNAIAKQYKVISTENDLDYEMKKYYRQESNYFYNQKDRATYSALKILNFIGVEAYFVKVKSKMLKDKLFEIFLHDYDMILHSKSEFLLQKLRDENVLVEEKRVSLIDDYINQRY